MKSIKPGRHKSKMGAAASIFGVIFGIIWTIAAISMGAPFFFPLFGLAFIGMGIYNAVYNYKNATSKNRYSEYDITDEDEEPDPLNVRYGQSSGPAAEYGGGFCPYCGAKAQGDFAFCPKCGKRLPQ